MDFINFMGPVITGISAIALALFLFLTNTPQLAAGMRG